MSGARVRRQRFRCTVGGRSKTMGQLLPISFDYGIHRTHCQRGMSQIAQARCYPAVKMMGGIVECR